MVTLTTGDLDFILRQIQLSEKHAAGEDLSSLISNPLLPWGVRTVDGSYNNILEGREYFGAADQLMPRLLEPVYREAEMGTSYLDSGTMIYDSQPRIISNLIADQSTDNPAAQAAAEWVADAMGVSVDDFQRELLNARTGESGMEWFIPNLAPDEGISAPFNAWMTFFGQFFDHGLDLIHKGDNGFVIIPLQPDDPLYVDGAHNNFLMVTRATQYGELGQQTNETTPFVDQNQTYTSHASHQVFLREYTLVDGKPVSTGHLLEGTKGGLATWADVKKQALDLLKIELIDTDIFEVPLLLTDLYGKFIPDQYGLPQVVTGIDGNGQPIVHDRTTANEVVNPTEVVALGAGRAFLDDIAHFAVPVGLPDEDTQVGNMPGSGFYDNELLDRHFITGDGRGNENIGLTAVHHVFHSEHNRMVEHVIELLEGQDATYAEQWKLPDGSWNGEYLFQAARFVTEMQYQHLVFEEFARTIQPTIDVFNFSHNVEVDAAIFAEFAHVVYRFGHSMLTDQIEMLKMVVDDQGVGTSISQTDIGLIEAFLNPVEFDELGDGNHRDSAGMLIAGMTRQVGNEIDEFVTSALRNNLVGLPLDLAAINIARGRDTGVPSLNEARAQFFEQTGDTQLKPYESWVDFAKHIKNPASVINFIAAYGTHDSITNETTVEGKRAAAWALVLGTTMPSDPVEGRTVPTDRLDFLNGPAANTGLNEVDFWIGGLAEKTMPFGGMLGSTFSFVFEVQLENLQLGDRFYYLSRVQGLNLLTELENNSFAKLIMANTSLGDPQSTHLPGNIFQAVNYILELNEAIQEDYNPGGSGKDPVREGGGNLNDQVLEELVPLVERGDNYLRYNGDDHVVLGGRGYISPDGKAGVTLIGGAGDDTLWGSPFNDYLEGGWGNDIINGGDGDDIIVNAGSDDISILHGDGGNDVIVSGTGLALIFGGDGQDFIWGGRDENEIFGGRGNDFIHGGEGPAFILGNEGDDWIEGGQSGVNVLHGDNSELFFNSPVIGHDVLIGGGNDTDFDAESGDDIMVQGMGINRNEGMFGFDWVSFLNTPENSRKGFAVGITGYNGVYADMRTPIFATDFDDILRDRFDQVEALSGSHYDDILIGDDRGVYQGVEPELNMAVNHVLTREGVERIDGLMELLGPWYTAQSADGNDPFDVIFDRGNIILGGAGSDIIMGNAGDDIIDGDAWLYVGIGYTTADGISGVANNMAELLPRMLSREINPGDLEIVRQIRWDVPEWLGERPDSIDVALYSDVYANYTIEELENGFWQVAHTGGTGTDGTDLLKNIEFVRFGDGVEIELVSNQEPEPVENNPATGAPVILAAGRNGQLTVDSTGIQDQDGLGTFSFQWQMAQGPEGAEDNDDLGEFAPLAGRTTSTFMPGAGQDGQFLRVEVSFTDGEGNFEQVFSTPMAVRFGANGNTNDTLTADPLGAYLNGGNGRDTLVSGEGNDIMVGGNHGDTFVFGNFDFGHDTIVDFTRHNNVNQADKIQLVGRQLSQAEETFDENGNLKLVFDGGDNSITLIGVNTVQHSDFIQVA